MKVLLANPPGDYVRCRWDISFKRGEMRFFAFPVRLAYATAVLKKNGYAAHIIDSTPEGISKEEFSERFKKIMPDVLIWETVASSFDFDLETLKVLKKINPKLIAVSSGYHATSAIEQCLNAGYDYVIVGECEYSILDLIRYIDKDTNEFSRGVASKRHKFVSRELIQNIDELPYPEREELPMNRYNDPKLNGFNVVMVSSRGCPWGCNFCTSPVYYGKSNYRMRSPKNVVDEMKFLWNRYKPDELYFDDDNFSVNKEHVLGICNEIVNRNLTHIHWNAMVDATIDYELLTEMKSAGCTGLTIGAESADDNVLKHMEGKRITRQSISEFVANCNRLNIRTHVCWVLGMKGSTKESDLNTIKFALSLNSFTMQFSIAAPYFGTKLYKWCVENKCIDDTVSNKLSANEDCAISYPNYSSNEILENLKYADKMWHNRM
ncbi:MAG: radical SAM protein [Candidatus Aenigmatarchaeota archaeon]